MAGEAFFAIGLVIGIIIGAVGMFFIYRANQKFMQRIYDQALANLDEVIKRIKDLKSAIGG